MAEENKKPKTVELWPGKTVEVVREDLFYDYDYIKELQEKLRNQDVGLISMLFVLVGGEPVLDEVRQHIIAEKGIFDVRELGKITKQILALIPKASSPAQKRW